MISLNTFDYILIIGFFALTLFIGIYVSKKSSKDSTEYFLSGRNMPWWLLGVSMVATTFSTDTPNFVTDIVRKDGVSANWMWWAFLITGLLTVFVYAKLWRKSDLKTDIEFYELRYGGKPAKFLRAFRALYLGFLFNIFAMAGVTLAAIKIGGIMLGLEPWETIIYAGTVTVIFSTLGGFKGVVYTDFILFFTAMAGAIGAAIYLVNIPEVGGIQALLSNENVTDKLSILPDFSNTEAIITLLIIPLSVQWWSSWYPGAEPGGGGYIAQRMLAAKDENNAIGATFFFNIMHYALRPWPWILVALASLVVFPDVASIKEAFPNIADNKLGHDLAYSAMLTKLPNGLLGLVLASLIAAYMSTISTHLNWGSSYIVNDFYKQHINKNASEKELVFTGKISTIILMIFSALFALYLQNAKQLFDIIIMFGAGTGLIFILRWFWWRINAWSEISAMIVSGVISLLFSSDVINELFFGAQGFFPSWAKFPLTVLITSIIWIVVTYLTKPENEETLTNFYKKTIPGGPSWKFYFTSIVKEKNIDINYEKSWNLSSEIKAILLGCLLIYSILFATGHWIYGNTKTAISITLLVTISIYLLSKIWKKLKNNFL
ncbi:sodium:solute symporter family protein [Polaribacter gangjinensis]|uniref:Na+:solute symporter n=1 Tax=Polaribacter gangjinensis TaxID=574710 RepID=A0A2S7WAW9_9FLAO|nr:sodium:solute symporter family protein [Polaribacter gangjinensis]PQJ74737.1 Na+:solute symporter [Polaribacter gangjinensis]